MSELLEQIKAAPDAPDPSKRPHRGLAPRIRKLKLKHPELSHSDIAKRVGCHPSNVTGVLKSFLGKHSESELQDFQENKASVMEAVQHRLLLSVTDKKINKTNAVQAVTAVAILEDKLRLIRCQATGINVNVLLDVAEAIRNKPAAPVIDAVQP